MMSESRAAQLLQGMSKTAQKVYTAIPIAEPWTTNQVAAEIIRLGLAISFPIMVGCINTLIRAKLVQEPTQRSYIRTPIRVRAVQDMVTAAETHHLEDEEDDDMPSTQMTATAPTKAKADATTRLGNLAASMRRMGDELKAMAGEIDNAALDAEAEIATLQASLERFAQLKTILKELT